MILVTLLIDIKNIQFQPIDEKNILKFLVSPKHVEFLFPITFYVSLIIRIFRINHTISNTFTIEVLDFLLHAAGWAVSNKAHVCSTLHTLVTGGDQLVTTALDVTTLKQHGLMWPTCCSSGRSTSYVSHPTVSAYNNDYDRWKIGYLDSFMHYLSCLQKICLRWRGLSSDPRTWLLPLFLWETRMKSRFLKHEFNIFTFLLNFLNSSIIQEWSFLFFSSWILRVETTSSKH